MKALFVSLYSATPHFETELELMSDLLAQGHEVHVLRCTGQLGTCLQNPEHRSGGCLLCTSKLDNAFAALRNERFKVEVLRPVAPDSRLPREFASAEELKNYSFEGANIGRGVYSTICSRINKNTRPDTRLHAEAIRRELEAAHHVYVAVKDVLQRVRPDRAYVFNGRFSNCYPVLQACEQLSVDCYTHERGGTPDRYLLRKNALPHDIQLNHEEILAVWESGPAEKVEQARSWFRNRRAGMDKSWESFTKAQSAGLLPDGFDPSKRNIAIFNSTMEEYASIKSWDPTLYPDEAVGVRSVVEALKANPNVHIYLRVHPNLKNIPRAENYQLNEYVKIAGQAKNLTIVWPESPIHTYALLDRCQVTLTFGSTVGAEACFWKKPSVLAGRAIYEQLDCCYAPKSHEEVIAMLLADLPAKDDAGALQYGYWETVRGTPFRRFKPTGLYTGTFEGKRFEASISARLQSAFLRVVGR